MAFATIEDLQAGWRTLTSTEQLRATTLLGRASDMLSAMVDVTNGDQSQAALLKGVCCSMVQRAMTSTNLFGVSQTAQTAGPYSESMTFANPSGDMYLTSTEKRLLGVGRSYATGCIKVAIHDAGGGQVDW